MSWQGREDLRRELREGDHTALAHTAHSLKGASANLGAQDWHASAPSWRCMPAKSNLSAPTSSPIRTRSWRSSRWNSRVHVALMLLAPEG